MIFLLDANLLLALGDHDHPHYDSALNFMKDVAVRKGWATCPLTEKAFLRILGRSRPGERVIPTSEVRKSLVSITANPGHQFWPDDISLTDSRIFPSLPNPKNLTDLYLLALAIKHGGCLATFDHRIDPSVLPGGAAAYYPIPV